MEVHCWLDKRKDNISHTIANNIEMNDFDATNNLIKTHNIIKFWGLTNFLNGESLLQLFLLNMGGFYFKRNEDSTQLFPKFKHVKA